MADIKYSLEVDTIGPVVFGSMRNPLDVESVLLGWTTINRSPFADIGVSSYTKAINVGGLVCINGCSAGIPLVYGVTRSMVEGNPATPSIALNYASMWRFKWSVVSGTRTISVRCKQAANLNPRPSITVEANPSIGILNDVTGSAGPSTDWVDIGPVTITPTSTGAVFVKLYNNLNATSSHIPTYFDHIVVT